MKELTPGTIYTEEVAPALIYNQEINVIIGDNLGTIEDDIAVIEETTNDIRTQCGEQCKLNDEILVMERRLHKLINLHLHLKMATHTRIKRGLLNFIGDISKTLFGTLSDGDLTLINANMDKLFDSQNKVKTIIANQTALIKKVALSSGIKQIEGLRKHLGEIENKLQRDAVLGRYLVRTELAITDTENQIEEILTGLDLGKAGVISSRLVDAELFLQHYRETLGQTRSVSEIEPTLQNFQHILDISRLTVFTVKKLLFFKVSIPVIMNNSYKLIRFHPIPIHHGNSFFTPIPEEAKQIRGPTTHMNVDETYLNKFCRVKERTYICQQKQPLRENTDKLCNKKEDNQVVTCNMAAFMIKGVTFIPLESKEAYIAVPEKQLNVKTLCDKSSKTVTIRQPTLLSADEQCTLILDDQYVHLGSTTKGNISYIQEHDNFTLPISKFSKELNTLVTAPEVLNNLKEYRTTIEELEDQTNALNFEHRVKSTIETTVEVLQYMGYTALGLGILYVTYKCARGCCCKGNLCIQLFNWKTNNSQQDRLHQSPPETPRMFYRSAPQALSITEVPEIEAIEAIIPKKRRVRI